jgi:putative inorganic carbon (hco3(-)) transporter
MLKKLNSSLLAIIIFLIPSNLFLKLFENTAYVNGLLIDYLIPKIYLSDVFILIFILVNLVFNKNISKQIKFNFNPITIFLLIIFTSYQLLAPNPIAAIYYLLKIILFIIFGLILKKVFKKLTNHLIIQSLIISLFFQSTLAIYQFHTQSALFNYNFLGEPSFQNQLILSKGIVFGQEKILPYATTAHPNILGGFLAIGFLFLFRYSLFKKTTSHILNPKSLILYSLFFIPTIYALFLTQSVSAWLALIFGLFVLFKNKWPFRKDSIVCCPYALLGLFILVPIIINLAANKYPTNPSITRRATLNQASVQMFLDKPIFGVGLNNFTAVIENYGNFHEVVKFSQPVHHLGLILLSETGLLGLLLIYLILKKSQILHPTSQILIILLPIAILDHYLLTNQTGLLIITGLVLASQWESAPG